MRKFILITISFVLSFSALASHSYGQELIRGKVTNTLGEGLLGVTVSLKGKNVGTSTNATGDFSINGKVGSIIIFTFVGFEPKEVVATSSTMAVELKPSNETMDEVVVIGYGTMKKRDVTGSIASVSGEKMSEYVVANPIQGLQGRVAGVAITTNTGAPNGNFTVRIRGSNSIRGGNDPLYIVDGTPSNPSSVNSLDIESVEVLKDASATAIYGSRASNGVVLITTKRGKNGQAVIAYDGNYGVQSQIKKLELMNSEQYMRFYNIQQLNDNGKEYFNADQIASSGTGTDWQSLVFKEAPIQNHNLTIAGGSEKIKVLISGSIMNRDGIIKNSSYNKYNLRSNIDYNFNDKLSAHLNMAYVKTGTDAQNSGAGNRGGSLIGGAISAPPTTGPFNEDGSYRNLQLAYPFMSNALLNPINLINEQSGLTRANLMNNNAKLVYKIIPGLSIRSSLGLETLDYRVDAYTSSKYLYGASSGSVSNQNDLSIINENILNYNKEFNGIHALDVTAGFTYQNSQSKNSSLGGTGFLSDAPGTDQMSGAALFGIPSTSFTDWTLMSYLGRINYSYKGRYLATLSGRADGSSRYSVGNKWGFFPSLALAWRLSEEEFIRDISWLSDLKLRVGYGKTGSTAINPYATLNMLSQGKTPINGEMGTYYTASSTLPSSLRWETTSQINIGLDASFLTNRLRVTADYYNKKTDDLLNSVVLPPSSGYGTTIRNIGKMENKGFELLVEGLVVQNDNLNWTVSGNISLNRNKITELYDGKDLYGSTFGLAYIDDIIHLLRVGEPMGVFYTYKETGYTADGNLEHLDVDKSGTLSNEDKMILGNPHPKFLYGFNSDLNYKGISLNLFFQGSYGNDIFNIGETANLDLGMGLNIKKDVLESHWSPEKSEEANKLAKYPKITRGLKLQYSDRYIEDGSYLRLKNISVGYDLPVKKWGITWCSQFKLYISAQNILTFTKYSGIDPEVNSRGGNIDIGVDYLTYPNVKTISFGTRVQF